MKDPQVFVYVPRTITECRQSSKSRPKNKKADGKKEASDVDESLLAVIHASCHVSEIDVQYDNRAATYPPCSSDVPVIDPVMTLGD